MRSGPGAGPWKITTPAALALGCAVLMGVAMFAQRGTQGAPPTVPPSNASGSRPGYTDPNVLTTAGSMEMLRGEDPSIRMMRQNARRDEMKKHMSQNATRLLLLSAELRADLQTREPTEADGKRLEEIAKLAHAVREQMKQ